eukprot:768768-Hanusia_phi.AAC.2
MSHGRFLGLLHLFAICVVESNLNVNIDGIFPAAGPANGGTQVTVIGSNLLSGKLDGFHLTLCKFGGSKLVPPAIVSSSLIICESPPQAVPNTKSVPLRVSTDGGYSFSYESVAFYYAAKDIVSTFFPNNGPERGETLVRVSGNAAWISGQLIECFSPVNSEASRNLTFEMCDRNCWQKAEILVLSFMALGLLIANRWFAESTLKL